MNFALFALLVRVIRNRCQFPVTPLTSKSPSRSQTLLSSISMKLSRFRIQFFALSLVLSCFVVLSTGCSPPREQAITTEDGEVATDFSADMIDDGTPVANDQPEANGDEVSEK